MDLSFLPLNSDEVPMDEYDVGGIWKAYAATAGIHVERIENIGTSMPDMFLIVKGLVLFHEMKMQRGNLVYMPHHQWSANLRRRHFMHPWQLSMVVYKQGTFKVISYHHLKGAPVEAAGNGKLKLNIELYNPDFTVSNQYEFNEYVEYFLSKAFKRPPKPVPPVTTDMP